MTCLSTVMTLALGLALSTPRGALAADPRPDAPGNLVGVSVEVEGREVPLYAAPDGSGRLYLEAREGARYSIGLANRSGERLGVVVSVDGLNVISGTRDAGPGRMYVLDPWDATTLRGWRTSLAEVRRFTFVDERTSYATRTGQANGRMGWIEVSVYRERRACYRGRPWCEGEARPGPLTREEKSRDQAAQGAAAPSPPVTAVPAPEAAKDAGATEARAGTDRGLQSADAPNAAPARPSFPGTGWGQRTEDRVTLVSFEPEARPAECLTLRYEYREALKALGIRVGPGEWDVDRLRERERGAGGFAKPPSW